MGAAPASVGDGRLFSAYLLLAGIERLLIEQIQGNVRFTLYGVHFTQAEFIALLFIAMGRPA
ncbi:MAG: hypothetical protein EOO78_07060 [Oxalobacteraceae bacterium]|nr:MAG: hypothetical protein EOO78_07060 [Oxalobacteraceae bacterium]